MPDRLNTLREFALSAVALLGILWATLRFVFEPHVRKVVKAVMAEESRQIVGISQRLRFVEDAVNELRRDGAEQDTALESLRIETGEGFKRLTQTLERIDENAQQVAKAVARRDALFVPPASW
jgi:hypothetical protein